MITANEILQAVKLGGLSNWSTTTKQHDLKVANTNRKINAENGIQEIYSVMHKGNWTAKKIQHATGMGKDVVYSRLATLIERGKIKRVMEHGIYLYYRV